MERQITKSAIEITAIILAIAAIWYVFRISTFSELSDTEAKIWLRLSEWMLIAFAIVLVFGLLGEWPDSDSWKKTTLYKAAKAAVVIGVLGELLGDAGVFETSARLQTLEEVAISKAAKTTEELKKENLKLEAKVAPRRMTREQAVKIAEALKPYVNRRLTVLSYPLDVDGSVLAMQLVDIGHAALGANLDDQVASAPLAQPFWIGIAVSGPDQAFVDAIVKAIGSATGFAIKAVPTLNLPSVGVRQIPGGPTILSAAPTVFPNSSAVILVGLKPLPR